MIEGVRITPLKQFADERGKVMHMLRADRPPFEKFGEVYFSTVKPGAVKAWRRHRKMTVNLAVPIGNILLVLFDDRENSPTRGQVQEVMLGAENYALATISPMIWNGFLGVGPEEALIVNCATLPHDPNEAERRNESDPAMPYDWSTGPSATG
ncbi:MAG: dTDP-4-dehydrorhamnose 3,5-epimerase family protein [Rhodospirillales bacterium]